jgi:hypothetical protein
MNLFAITISITDGKGHVVLADQAHDEASSSRVELRFRSAQSLKRTSPLAKSRSSGAGVPSSLQPWSLSTGADLPTAFLVACQRAWEGQGRLEHHSGSRTPIRRW